MGDNNLCKNSSTTSSSDQISLFLSNLFASSSSPFVVGDTQKVKQMPYSSYYSSTQPSSSSPLPQFLACSGSMAEERGDEEDAGAGGVASMGFDPGSLLHSRGKPPEDFDSYDCESEEGFEVSEEPSKQIPSRGSGSKRSRAAEVHNLSEKRRRSRINEKMKALQNLIPNSNKTDKASMLDEAIEYLKQLQLQVQMLSMRNGLNLHPVYLPGTLQSLQASQMHMGFGVDNGSVMNMGVGMLPLNQNSSAQSSFDLATRCTSSHQPMVVPRVTNITSSETSFGMESSQSHHESFQLPVSTEEIFTEDMVPHQQLDTGHTTRNMTDEMKSMSVAAPLSFTEQLSMLEDTSCLDARVLGRERPQGMLSKDQDNQIFIQHLHGLQTGRGFPCGDVKAESLEL